MFYIYEIIYTLLLDYNLRFDSLAKNILLNIIDQNTRILKIS